MKALKYLTAYSVPLTVWISFNSEGILTFLPLIVFFGLVPFAELVLPENKKMADVGNDKNKVIYDAILYSLLPIQVFFLFYFLGHIEQWNYNISLLGKVISMGIMCGVIGINVGHELGHRMRRWEKLIGEMLLFTSLENHFLPYHNRGHHANVATREDPATAREKEALYLFWFRSHFGSYIQAWKIEIQRMRIMNKKAISLSNSMVVYTLCHMVLLGSVYFYFGYWTLFLFLCSASIGILLLETVNYIEHYALQRKKRENGTYERVQRWHSWNSDHVLGRLILFELSRHSDHHYKADRPYQQLESHEGSPNMPTGYPGMMLLATIPPLFFVIMDQHMKKLGLEKN